VLAKAFFGLAFLLIVLGVALFAPAGTLEYWHAWVFLAVFGAVTLAITLWLAARDPALLARRVQAGPLAEPKLGQKIVQSLASLAFIAVFVLAGFDHRRGWSRVPDVIAIAGDVLVALGLGGVFLVFRENTYTSATIEVAREQTLVKTGPYAIVRHPMYACAFVMLLGVPIALGSWIALIAVVPLFGAIVWRLLDEEKVLGAELPGYAEYRAEVTSRLVPHVW
jgi:protein-S-isoprenylcysteine O-methyltransferase Ste14